MANPARREARDARSGRGASRKVTTVAMVLVACLSTACSSDAGAGGDRPLVVATTTQLADFARIVGGDAVEVRGLLRANVDAHDFDPTPADLDALARADVILANGVGLEPWLDDAVAAAGASAEVTDTSQGAELLAIGDAGPGHDVHDDDGSDDGHDHDGGWNPHLWLDPDNARTMVGNVAAAITAALPEPDADAVSERATTYDRELADLDAELRAELADLEVRTLVTDHDAFPYLADHFDLEIAGTIIPSFDSSAEVSPGDLDDLARTIENEGVPAIFTEQSLPPNAAQALARKVDVEVVSGEDGLYGDSLGPEGSAGATYVEMMRHNVSTISRHLR